MNADDIKRTRREEGRKKAAGKRIKIFSSHKREETSALHLLSMRADLLVLSELSIYSHLASGNTVGGEGNPDRPCLFWLGSPKMSLMASRCFLIEIIENNLFVMNVLLKLRVHASVCGVFPFRTATPTITPKSIRRTPSPTPGVTPSASPSPSPSPMPNPSLRPRPRLRPQSRTRARARTSAALSRVHIYLPRSKKKKAPKMH